MLKRSFEEDSNEGNSPVRPGLLRLKSQAAYTVPGDFQADTEDNEDHTFSGIMFPVEVLDLLPVEYIEIQTVAVRGNLGKMTIWSTTAANFRESRLTETQWIKHHEHNHDPSPLTLVEMHLDPPIIARPGGNLALYVHSAEDSDTGLVYDNQRSLVSAHDQHLVIRPGMAHLSAEPFSNNGFYGWGNAWRNRREFVGRISYGVKFKLWRPVVHANFPNSFKDLCQLLLLIHNTPSSPLYVLPSDVILYLVNMLPWNWGGGLRDEESRTLKEFEEEKKKKVTAAPTLAFLYNHIVNFQDDEDDEDDEDDYEDDYIDEEESDLDNDDDDDESAAGTEVQTGNTRHVFRRFIQQAVRIVDEERPTPNPRFREAENNSDHDEEEVADV